MTNSNLDIQKPVILLSLLAILGGLIIPKEWVQDYFVWAGVFLILGGIPHGAADYQVFLALWKNRGNTKNRLAFISVYLLVLLGYGLLWWLVPTMALLIFLIISSYHFGQSNWSQIQFKNQSLKVLSYMLWGAFVIFVPVFIYYQEAAQIIFEITGQQFPLDLVRWPALYLISFFNLIHILKLQEKALISVDQLYFEWFKLGILFLLFASTPLLWGFGIYFVFWHALGATFDQLNFLKKENQNYNWMKHLSNILPLSLLAFAGLLGLYYISDTFIDQGIQLGTLFLFISLVTVPHSILIDKLYMHDLQK